MGAGFAPLPHAPGSPRDMIASPSRCPSHPPAPLTLTVTHASGAKRLSAQKTKTAAHRTKRIPDPSRFAPKAAIATSGSRPPPLSRLAAASADQGVGYMLAGLGPVM